MYSKLRDKIVHEILMENYLDKYDFNKTVQIINDICKKEKNEEIRGTITLSLEKNYGSKKFVWKNYF